MSELGSYSPSFKKPSDVLRMRRKRARSEGHRTAAAAGSPGSGPSTAAVRPFSPGRPSLVRGRGGGLKRRNPFAKLENTYGSPKERAAACTEGSPEPKRSLAAFSDVLDRAERLKENVVDERPAVVVTQPQKPASFSEDSLFEDDLTEVEKCSPDRKSPEAPAGCHTPPVEVCREYPADWSLKTRLLFTSTQSFSWAEHLKAQEEAQGLSLHCRAEYARLPQNIQEPRTCGELRSAFQQSLQYWQHPTFSWLGLFPRIGAERAFQGKSTPWAQDTALQQSLMGEWSVSLTSLYSLLKAKLCPYFYVCSYQFTALFRAAGLSGARGITALLSPTTRGLREAMKAEGIEFSLPLLEEKRKNKESCSSQNNSSQQAQDEANHKLTSEHSDNEEDVDEEEEDDDDGGFSWLKEMGVQDQIKKPDAISIKLRKEHDAVRLDHRPESVVLVAGSNTFTLINFLINCKGLVAGAGSQAGLPPTLLAPSAFRGATLHTLKARSVNVKTQERAAYKDVCSLEVTGPIMPHTLHALTQLLRPAQRGEFSAVLYTHEPSAVLNVPSTNVPTTKTSEPDQQEKAVQELGQCGLQRSTVEQLVEPAALGKAALRQLQLTDYSYTWRT
ncbi:protein downstream neighbor of son homolog [Brachyhypopomus gauderio]|uniref:protein downstream neighbor of son homolog n=1 Tax=Brachyhypopomus gauderio TaxID=698409 RepID=UPI004042C4C2